MDTRVKPRKKLTADNAAKFNSRRELAFQNLVALQCPFRELGKKNNVSVNKFMFDKPNKPGLIAICYFLFRKLNEKRVDELFKYCYPPYDKKQEQEFQKVCLRWLKECAKDNPGYKFPAIAATIFMKTGGIDAISFVFMFSSYVLDKCTRSLCTKHDSVLLPPQQCHESLLETFQKVAIKSATCTAISNFTRNFQVGREADNRAETLAASMLQRFRAKRKRIEELKRKKAVLLEKLKDYPCNNRSQSKTDIVKTSKSKINMDLKSLRTMWDGIISLTDETGLQREIVQSVISQSATSEQLNAASLDVKIPTSLLRDCNQEVCEEVGASLYRGEKLDLVSFVRLTNIMLKQILLKLEDGLPNFESSVTVTKAQCLLHSKRSVSLVDLKQNIHHLISEAKKMNAQLREKVDCRNYERSIDKYVLIPGLPCPDVPSIEPRSTFTDNFDIVTLSPPRQFSTHASVAEKTLMTPSSTESSTRGGHDTNAVTDGINIVPANFRKEYPSHTTLNESLKYTRSDFPSASDLNESSKGLLLDVNRMTPKAEEASLQHDGKNNFFDGFHIASLMHSFPKDSTCQGDSETHLLQMDETEVLKPDIVSNDSPSVLKQGHILLRPSSPLKSKPNGDYYKRSPHRHDFRPMAIDPSLLIAHSPIRRKLATDKLVDRIVNFTLGGTEQDRMPDDTFNSGIDDFHLSTQLDTAVFNSVDKLARASP